MQIQRGEEPAENDVVKEMRAAAAMATSTGFGNCREFAALAFTYLYDYKIRPVDCCAWDYGVRDSHAFVVLGRQDGSQWDDPTTWGPSCCICDPWNNQVFVAGEYQMRGFKKPTEIYPVRG